MGNHVAKLFQRQRRHGQRVRGVPGTMFHDGRRGPDRVGNHCRPAVLVRAGSGDAERAVLTQRVHVDQVKTDVVAGRFLHHDRRPGVAQGQAGESGVHESVDLFLGRFGQMRDVLAADDHPAANRPRLDQCVDHVDCTEHAGTGVADVEHQGIVKTESLFQSYRRTGLVGHAIGAVESGDVRADHQVDVFGRVA